MVASKTKGESAMKTLIDMIDETQREKTGMGVESEILQEAAEAMKKDTRTKAVEACKGLIGSFKTALDAEVSNLRTIRETEKTKAAKVRKLDRAFRFFAKTANPFPMLKAMGKERDGRYIAKELGVAAPDKDSDAWEIPADWTDKA